MDEVSRRQIDQTEASIVEARQRPEHPLLVKRLFVLLFLAIKNA
jgi:hypothetical protein